MYTKLCGRRWACIAVVPLVCVAFPTSLVADEAPADDQNSAPIRVNLNANAPLQDVEVGLELSNTQFMIEAIHLAANTDLIGAEVAQVDDVVRSHLGLGDGKGLVVVAIGGDGPAAAAGIQQNDVLITVGDEEIANLETFHKLLDASAEKPIAIGLIRAGNRQSIEVTPRSTARWIVHGINEATAQPKFWLGLGLTGADDTLRSQLALPAGEGLVVTGVESDSPAAKSGVMINDVLLKLDGKALTTIESLAAQLQAIADRSVPLELLRRGKPAMLTVTPEKHAEPVAAALHWLNLSRPAWTDQYQSFVGWQSAEMASDAPSKSDFVQQLNDLDAQVKQLEASLSALKNAIQVPAPPAQIGEEKK